MATMPSLEVVPQPDRVTLAVVMADAWREGNDRLLLVVATIGEP